MSLTNNIEFRRNPTQNRQPASPRQGTPSDGDEGDNPPERRSQTGLPDVGAGTSERNPSRRLEEYAVARARHDRLSATAEEGLIGFSRLGHEEKLIDLYSKVTHIEQQMGRSETDAAESQSNFELPSLPKQIMSDIRYKAALILMSTAEQMSYLHGKNRPAAMIMESFKGRQGFDKSWLTGAKENVLRLAIGKVCDDLRYGLKCRITESIDGKDDVLTFTANAVSHLSKHCNDITAHEALAIRMAFLRAVYLEDSSSKFWATVDNELETVRKGCAEPDAISFTERVFLLHAEYHTTDANNRALNQIYNKDLTAYPPDNRSLLSQARPTPAQSDMNRHVQSRS